MTKRIRTPVLLFYGLIAVMLVVCTVGFVAALSWINKPFAGFLIYHCPYVGSMSLSDWPGRQAGLKFLDPVLSVDGEPVIRGRDVVAAVENKEPETPVRYVIKTEGAEKEVVLPVTTFTLGDYFFTFLINLLGGMVVFALGCVVYILKPRSATSWVFLVFTFALSGYMVTSFEILSTYHLIHFHYFVLPFMGITGFHLGLIFPDRRRFLLRYPKIEYLIYVPFFILAILYQIYFFTLPGTQGAGGPAWLPSYKFLGTATRVLTLACAIGLVCLWLESLYRASSITARQRAKMMLLGAVIAFLPSSMIMMAFYLLKVNFPWNFVVIFIIFFPASIAYSIVRHNLFDADAVIKRTVGYVVATVIVVGAYAGVSLALNVFAGKYELAQSRAFPILFTLGVVLVFNPLRDRVQDLVDRVFFRKEYDYGAILDRVSSAMTSLLDLQQVVKQLIQTFIEDMFINTSSVMLFSPAGGAYQVCLAEGERKQDVESLVFKRDEPLIQVIEKEKRELTKYDMLEDPRYTKVCEACTANFDALRASLMVPLVYQEEVIGVLNLGEKKSGKPYRREDIELLRTLAHQGAVAIENARLFQENLEKQRMEADLNIARDLQMSMLPSACPEVKGFKIAARSIPAREVGGDFFDFIDMGEGQIGFVIGDVTGKSVSGALVMAASRSVFRMLSQDKLPVSQIMLRANQRIKKDIKSGMFVALLYALLDAEKGSLILCSAGQTQPIHFSARKGTANLVQTEGDSFPLGILDEADYQDTELKLEPGDRVVFYTDGIVEAMNEKKEIFGFEQVQKVVEEGKNLSADALLEHILERVNAFVGQAVQHDDLTAIVVSVEDELKEHEKA
jgi:sigma-B regulation protein RsbU (phosphoserine phosphatase)